MRRDPTPGGVADRGLSLSVCAQADIVVTSLPGPSEIEQAAFGDAGMLSALRPGSLWVDTSTNDPALAEKLGREVSERDCAFVDAPVTGGAIGAREGSLLFMAGGDEGHVGRARPVLLHMGSRLLHTGPVGTGCAMKLIVNHLGITHIDFQWLATRPDSHDIDVCMVDFEPGGRNRSHTHLYDQILVVMSGRGIVATASDEHTVGPGDVAVIAAGEPHWHGAGEAQRSSHLTIEKSDNRITIVDEES